MLNHSIINAVNNYNNKQTVRFHMPGHKGKKIGSFLDSVFPFDLTELPETDNLFGLEDEGILFNLQKKITSVYQTKSTLISVGGATLALQAAITACVIKTGCNIMLCERQVHISVINTFALCDVNPVWFFYDNIDLIPDIIKKYNKIAAVIITSPDYYGNMKDINKIRLCIGDTIPLIVDNSHGAHLKFYDNGKLYELNYKADFVIDSIHKTLPAMTGCALLHSNTELISRRDLCSAMSLFSTTSPSYILMSSIEACIDYMVSHTDDMKILYDEITDLKNILALYGYNITNNYNGLYDPFRICIHDKNALNLYDFLYNENVVCEFADNNNLIAIPSVMNNHHDFEKIISLCKCFIPENVFCENKKYKIPIQHTSIKNAVFSEKENVDIKDSYNRIAARYIAPYPPGIPLIIPGELIDLETQDVLISNNIKNIEVIKN